MKLFQGILPTLCVLFYATVVYAHSSDTEAPGMSIEVVEPSGPSFKAPLPGKINSPGIYRKYVLQASLVDQHNRPFSLEQLHGQTVLLHFIYTDCVDVCPLQANDFNQIRQSLHATPEGERISFVSITISPEIDIAEKMMEFSSSITGKVGKENLSNWYFVTGEPNMVRLLGKTLGVVGSPSNDGSLIHQTNIYLLDFKGNLRQQYYGNPANTGRILKEVRLLSSLAPINGKID